MSLAKPNPLAEARAASLKGVSAGEGQENGHVKEIPFVNHLQREYTFRCCKCCCTVGQHQTTYGARSASIRKNEFCTWCCPFSACEIRQHAMVPWRNVILTEIDQGFPDPSVFRLLAFIMLLVSIVVLIILMEGDDLNETWEWIVVFLAPQLFGFIISLIFRENFLLLESLSNKELATSRIPLSTPSDFREASTKFMLAEREVKDESETKLFKHDVSVCGCIPFGCDEISFQRGATQIVYKRACCNFKPLGCVTTKIMRTRDIMWTFLQQSKRNTFYLLGGLIFFIVFIVLGTSDGADTDMIVVAVVGLVLGFLAYFLVVDAAVTFALRYNTIPSANVDRKDLEKIRDTVLEFQLEEGYTDEIPRFSEDGTDLADQASHLYVYPNYIRQRSTCNWKKYGCCLCCKCLCAEGTTKCIGWMCGFAEISGMLRKRTYIGIGKFGNPHYLVLAVLTLLLGLVLTVAFVILETRRNVPAEQRREWLPIAIFVVSLFLTAILGLIWYCTRREFVSVGLPLADKGAPNTLNMVDGTSYYSTTQFRPGSKHIDSIIYELDGLAESAYRRRKLKEQQREYSSVVWIERMSEAGEFYYEHSKAGDTKWDVRSFDVISSEYPWSDFSTAKPQQP